MSPGTADEAAAWDARLRAPDCTDDDRARFAAWCNADPVNRLAFERLQTIVASFRHYRGRADVRALRDEALRASTQHRRRFWGGVLAASCGTLALAAVLWSSSTVHDWLSPTWTRLSARLRGGEVFSTGIGQRSTFVLEDGSSVELDARSKIKVAFTQARRDVELLEGQALFKVAGKSGDPFIVRAGNQDIVALGTMFDVRLDERSVQVTLLEGKVRVERSGATGGVVLTPGKQLIASTATTDTDTGAKAGAGGAAAGNGPAAGNGAAASEGLAAGDGAAAGGLEPQAGTADPDSGKSDIVRDVDVGKVTGWRDGRVFFENLSLPEAVAEMNRYSSVEIKVDGAELARIHLNGMFRAGDQDAFVTALQEYFPISVERGAGEIILTTRR